MIFASLPLSEADGGVAAHSIRLPDHKIKKGQIITGHDLAMLKHHDITHVMVARLEAHDVDEDQAAETLATSLMGTGVRCEGPATGRSNLFAASHGVLRIDAAQIDAVNMVSEAITVATLPNWRVEEGEMVGTVKIIPFAVPSQLLGQCCQIVEKRPPLHVAPFIPKRVGLIATTLPGLKSGVIRKTAEVLQKRLAVGGSQLTENCLVAHDEQAVRMAICDMVPRIDVLIIFGASAMTDRRDVVPSALEQAGGRIVHFGMPVDPGNLLLLGEWNDPKTGRCLPVIGAPGCARSPKENGFDWILQRVMADINVTREDIMRLGHGGLLMDVIHRGLPRAAIGDDP